MKLYTTKGAVSPARVQFFLAEKGLEIEYEQVNLMAGEHKTAEYRAKVPNGLSPAFELDSGQVICEIPTICRYVEAKHPEPALLGSTPEEAATIDMWDRMMEFQLMLPMAMTFRHTHPAMAVLEKQFKDYGESQRGVAIKRLKRLNREIEGRDFIAGDSFSIADITAYCSIRFFRFELTDDWPNLQAWFKRIKERPAAAHAFA